MDIEQLRKRWRQDFGGEKGSYPTFEAFLHQYQSGMRSIEKELAKPQQLTSEEKALLDHLDAENPVVENGGENKG